MDDLATRLRALHVWPQIVADYHADILLPRQIDGLYEIGPVAHEAADRITAQAAEIEKYKAENEWLCAALKAYRDRKRRP